MWNHMQQRKQARPASKNERLVSTYRFIGIEFFIVLVGPDGYLWQELWYVGQGCHPVLVFHAVKSMRNRQKTC